MSVFLTSSDGKLFTVEEKVAFKSVLIKNMLEDLGESDPASPIPILNVDSIILEKVIEYATHHKDNVEDKEWDSIFTDSVDKNTMFAIIMAANFLDMKDLLDTGCQTVANMIKGKSVDEIEEILGLENYFERETIEFKKDTTV
jgi:S-phase kinase-associated protein 1